MTHKFKISNIGHSPKIITVYDFEKDTDWSDYEDALAEAVKEYCDEIDTTDMLKGLEVKLMPEELEAERPENERFLIYSQIL